LTVVNDNHGFPCMLFGHEGVESMLMTKLVLAAAIAFAISTTAAAQTPEGVPLLKTLPADGTTIANYYKQNVYDPADQKIGQILDLVIKKDGAVPAAIVSVGGFLGIATKYVAVPFHRLAGDARRTPDAPGARHQQEGAAKRAGIRVQSFDQALGTVGGRLVSRTQRRRRRPGRSQCES
jgi:hypothetical protein